MAVNVLQLNSSLDTGGAERVIAHLTRHLDRDRFRVWPCHLFSPSGAIGDELKREGYDVIDIGRPERGIGKYLTFRLLRRLVRERRIDVIHSHTHYALVDASLCRLTSIGGARVVHTFHFGNYPHVQPRYLWLERFGARVADRLVAVGVEQERRVRAALGLSAGRIDVVPNGVEEASATPDDAWAARIAERGAVVVGTVCTFIEQKGLPELLETARAVVRARQDVVFLVVGDGALRPSVEAQCRAMGLGHDVLFAGWKPRAQSTMLPLFDIFFQPSRWEAMSMVVLEAMAASRPVVATDVGDNRHVVSHGASGFVLPVGDVQAMADALLTLVADPALRRQFGAVGRARFDAYHRVEHMAHAYERLYEDVLGRGACRPSGAPERPGTVAS